MPLSPEDLTALRYLIRDVVREELDRVPRASRPKAPTSEAIPMLVTQNNCEAAVGLTPRQFLELLRREDAPAASRVGKLRAVRTDVIVAYLARLDARVREPVEDETGGADAVLREIGCAPVRRRG